MTDFGKERGIGGPRSSEIPENQGQVVDFGKQRGVGGPRSTAIDNSESDPLLKADTLNGDPILSADTGSPAALQPDPLLKADTINDDPMFAPDAGTIVTSVTPDHLFKPDDLNGDQLFASDDSQQAEQLINLQPGNLFRPDDINDDQLIAPDSIDESVNLVAGFTWLHRSESVSGYTEISGELYDDADLSEFIIDSHSATQQNTLQQVALVPATPLLLHSTEQSSLLSESVQTQHHAMTVDSLEQSVLLAASLLTEHAGLQIDPLGQSHEIAALGAFTQSHRLAPSTVTQTVNFDTLYLQQGGVLTALPIQQSHTLSQPNSAQHGKISLYGLEQGQVFFLTNFSVNTDIVVQSTTQEQGIANLSLTPILLLLGIDQSQVLTDSTLDTSRTILLRDLTQDQAIALTRFTGMSISYLEGEIVMYSTVEAEPFMGAFIIGDTYITS